MATKRLKIWNGRGHGKFSSQHIYVAAYSMAEAARLISQSCYDISDRISVQEIKNYYSDCWGNVMKGIIPTEPCLYISDKYSKPIKII